MAQQYIIVDGHSKEAKCFGARVQVACTATHRAERSSVRCMTSATILATSSGSTSDDVRDSASLLSRAISS
eukprot:6208023-Pleurochrysis_carterae.AAC.1